jgi:hypothetical protein
MDHEALAPPVSPPVHEVLAADVAGQTAQVPAPTPEHVQAADHVFTQREEESKQVEALLGLYAGVMLGHQLLVETFERRDEREEAEREKEKPEPKA